MLSENIHKLILIQFIIYKWCCACLYGAAMNNGLLKFIFCVIKCSHQGRRKIGDIFAMYAKCLTQDTKYSMN